MKSMLHEASSVAKAIEKAWVASGKPEKFTINVLESGKKSFFGLMTERPAIISITFEPKKMTREQEVSAAKGRRNVAQKGQARSDDKRENPQDTKNTRTQGREQKPRDGAKGNLRQTFQESEKALRPAATMQANSNGSSVRSDRPEKVANDGEMWGTEFVDQIKGWLQEICSLMAISVPFETQINKKNLHIVFQERIITPEDERALYHSFSYLLMQFLKKCHKRKFHNCHIVISTKDSGAHDKRSDNSQE